jgi:hypothetical protein
VWVAPAEGSTVKTAKVTLSATAASRLPSVNVTKVQFYAAWGSASPTAACAASKADAKGVWSCKTDLWKLGAPLGALTLSFDVFDDAGDLARSPAGTRLVTLAAPPPAPTGLRGSGGAETTKCHDPSAPPGTPCWPFVFSWTRPPGSLGGYYFGAFGGDWTGGPSPVTCKYDPKQDQPGGLLTKVPSSATSHVVDVYG